MNMQTTTDLSDKTFERICRIFGYLDQLEVQGVTYVSSRELAQAAGTTDYTVRKDISLLGVTGFTRAGYEVKSLHETLGNKLRLNQTRKACIVGLGRLGTALLDYTRFEQNGFKIIAGFDGSINKIERIRSSVDIFPVSRLEEVIKERSIELGIISVPAPAAQSIADELVKAGIKGILNFSSVVIQTPQHIIHVDIDFTNALRFIAARLPS